MKNKWASLSPNGFLSFNSALLDEKTEFIDHVIVHELVHFRVPNHGKLFKSLLSAYLSKLKSMKKQEEKSSEPFQAIH